MFVVVRMIMILILRVLIICFKMIVGLIVY